MANRSYPTGKAQQMVLGALKLSAKDFSEANQVFESLGIVVSSRREGRSSVPIVTVKDRFDGGFNNEGEGVEYRKYQDYDFSAIEQWIE